MIRTPQDGEGKQSKGTNASTNEPPAETKRQGRGKKSRSSSGIPPILASGKKKRECSSAGEA